ncbi:MAG TPA: triphosphoribosyl-dephospho-CoA synthase, partial [Bacilli bacterium]|nr:triphosphoribosyl-dephospho-CoA synthase [Bacilli bacterium]
KSTTDTVLFARAKTEESYHHFKDLITSIKVYDETRIKEVTEECIKNNISIGGSADILVVAIFLYLLREEFFGRE